VHSLECVTMEIFGTNGWKFFLNMTGALRIIKSERETYSLGYKI
jgi:hypothetical protein